MLQNRGIGEEKEYSPYPTLKDQQPFEKFVRQRLADPEGFIRHLSYFFLFSAIRVREDCQHIYLNKFLALLYDNEHQIKRNK